MDEPGCILNFTAEEREAYTEFLIYYYSLRDISVPDQDNPE
jgi:hypothetical protein